MTAYEKVAEHPMTELDKAVVNYAFCATSDYKVPSPAERAAAELLALREKVAEMKKDLAKCFLELSENNSENFADELAEKYFETWGEIRDLVEGKQS